MSVYHMVSQSMLIISQQLLYEYSLEELSFGSLIFGASLMTAVGVKMEAVIETDIKLWMVGGR